jgi:uncharacterized protein
MPITLHDLLVPAYLRGFAAMSAYLEKARDHADANGIAHAELLEARLFPDMAPLTGQVQRASDTAKFAVARLSGTPGPSMADDEASFAELAARISATVEYLKSVPADAVNGREDADVELKAGGGSFMLKGLGYAQGFALPNFYFHITTAYAILRHKGVPLGKMDYLGVGTLAQG